MVHTLTRPLRYARAVQAGALAAVSRVQPAKLSASHAAAILFSIHLLPLAERSVILLAHTIIQREYVSSALMELTLILILPSVKHVALGALFVRLAPLDLLSPIAQPVSPASLLINTLAEKLAALTSIMTGLPPPAKTVQQALSLIPNLISASLALRTASHAHMTQPSSRHATHVLLHSYWTHRERLAEHPVLMISHCIIRHSVHVLLAQVRQYLRTQRVQHALLIAHHAQETQLENSSALAA